MIDNILNFDFKAGVLTDELKLFLIEKVFNLLTFHGFNVNKDDIDIQQNDYQLKTVFNDTLRTFYLRVKGQKTGLLEFVKNIKNNSLLIDLNIEIFHDFIEKNKSIYFNDKEKKHLARLTECLRINGKCERFIHYAFKKSDSIVKDGTIAGFLISNHQSHDFKKHSISFSLNDDREIVAIQGIDNYPDNECLLGGIVYEKIILSLYRKVYPDAFKTILPQFSLRYFSEHKENFNEILVLLNALII